MRDKKAPGQFREHRERISSAREECAQWPQTSLRQVENGAVYKMTPFTYGKTTQGAMRKPRFMKSLQFAEGRTERNPARMKEDEKVSNKPGETAQKERLGNRG